MKDTILMPGESSPREVEVLSPDYWRHIYALRRHYRELFDDDEWAELTSDESPEDREWLISVGLTP